MSFGNEGLQPQEYTMADRATAEDRGQFIVKTYVHLMGAVFAFVAIETILQLTVAETIFELVVSAGNIGWLVVLGGFMAVSWVANSMAHSNASLGTQYMGLSLYVVAESFIFVPIIYIAVNMGYPEVLPSAAMATAFIFSGLTAVVFVTRKNFSFMKPFLGLMGIGALAYIVCGLLFNFNFGTGFTIFMIVLAAGYILYSTSNILHEYNTKQYVAASLALFAAVALLFWYILQLFMNRR